MLSTPIQWLVPAVLARLVLLLNHVVASEPQAAGRLQPHAGRVIDIRWAPDTSGVWPALAARVFQGAASPPPIRLLITPAGLFESVTEEAPAAASSALATATLPGLTLTVRLSNPIDMLQRTARGERPEVNIEGDASLAEVASWLMTNLRWDIQDDVARFLGNTPAEVLRKVGEGVREALQRWRPGRGAPR